MKVFREHEDLQVNKDHQLISALIDALCKSVGTEADDRMVSLLGLVLLLTERIRPLRVIRSPPRAAQGRFSVLISSPLVTLFSPAS